MYSIYKTYLKSILIEEKEEFLKQRFAHNNLMILFLSIFLTIEQMYYGFYVSENGSLLQNIYILTACIMLIYAILSINIKIKKIVFSTLIFKIYEISFGLCGFFIAVVRALLIQNEVFRLPTVFIAVLYGFAVIFYFKPFETLMIYAFTSGLLILLLPIFQPTITTSSYVEDAISNAMIAWIVSIVNYHKYVKEFINKKIIEVTNQNLEAKTEQIQQMNEKLKRISIKDGLTNIYNRRKLDEVLKDEYNYAKNENEDLSVIIIDLDKFKLVNDTYGHIVGDKVLIEISDLLKKNIRPHDTVGRWGGEEFLIVCPKTNSHQAFTLAEDLRKKIEKHEFDEIDCRTSSFGVAMYKEGDTVEDIIKRADMGLYTAKENGRNQVVAC